MIIGFKYKIGEKVFYVDKDLNICEAFVQAYNKEKSYYDNNLEPKYKLTNYKGFTTDYWTFWADEMVLGKTPKEAIKGALNRLKVESDKLESEKQKIQVKLDNLTSKKETLLKRFTSKKKEKVEMDVL